MLGRIFPRLIDNVHRGYAVAILLLALIVLTKLAMAGASLFDTSEMIRTADSIPLERFGEGGVAAVVTVTKLLGLNHLLLNLMGLIVLVRYRALIPLTYVLLLIEQLGRKAVVLMNPIARTGESYLPVDPNLILTALLLIGLALSLGKTEAERARGAVT